MKGELNGEIVELERSATVVDAADRLGVGSETRGVAVAVDGEVIPRRQWTSTPLKPEQKIEIVRAMQGGAPSRRLRPR